MQCGISSMENESLMVLANILSGRWRLLPCSVIELSSWSCCNSLPHRSIVSNPRYCRKLVKTLRDRSTSAWLPFHEVWLAPTELSSKLKRLFKSRIVLFLFWFPKICVSAIGRFKKEKDQSPSVWHVEVRTRTNVYAFSVTTENCTFTLTCKDTEKFRSAQGWLLYANFCSCPDYRPISNIYER